MTEQVEYFNVTLATKIGELNKDMERAVHLE